MSPPKPPRPRPRAQAVPQAQREGGDIADLDSQREARRTLPHSHDPARLRALADGARQALTPEERKATAGALVELLVALRDPGNEPAEAKAILEVLDLGLLHDLEDERGRSARREAVETLTSLGFPWAMQVSAEDLRYAHQWTPPAGLEEAAQEGGGSAALTEWERRMSRWRWVAAGLSGAGQLAAVLLEATRARGPDGHLGAAMLAGVLGLVLPAVFAVRRPGVQDQVAYGAALLLTVAASLALALVAGASGVVSLLGSGLAFAAAFGWQVEPAGADPASLQRDYEKWREAQRFK